MCAKRGFEVSKEELDEATTEARESRLPIDTSDVALELATGRFSRKKVKRGGVLTEIDPEVAEAMLEAQFPGVGDALVRRGDAPSATEAIDAMIGSGEPNEDESELPSTSQGTLLRPPTGEQFDPKEASRVAKEPEKGKGKGKGKERRKK